MIREKFLRLLVTLSPAAASPRAREIDVVACTTPGSCAPRLRNAGCHAVLQIWKYVPTLLSALALIHHAFYLERAALERDDCSSNRHPVYLFVGA